MPLDNNGNPFEYISITTLHATSEAIIQPLSRPVGYNRRLVHPMPHPYGSIGQARPTNRLPINVGPRPGAPLKEKYKNPRTGTPAPTTGKVREELRDNAADALQPADAPRGFQNTRIGAQSATEGPSTVGPHNGTPSEDQLVTLSAAAEEERQMEKPIPCDIDNPASSVIQPVLDPSSPSGPYGGDNILEDD